MHWADINATLYKRGTSPTQVARELDVCPDFVSRVIRAKATSYNVATALSVATGIPLSRLFPDGRYNKPPRTNRQRASGLSPTKRGAAA